MTDKDIMIAGARKMSSITIYMKGVDGSPEIFVNVKSWRIGYNGILTLQGDGWTDVMSLDVWNRVQVTEE